MAAADLERGWQMPDRLAGALGFARSLAIYHGLPWRTRALTRHYAAFVAPGDLAFDVGAHVGNHTRCLARLGVRVLAVEPQPGFAAWLRWLFRNRPEVGVIEGALAAAPGVVELHRSPRTPTVATTSRGWIDKVRTSAGFEEVRWAEAITVPAITLDALIARHGLPRLCKIDVEGYEAEVLAGLSTAIPALSFEYLPAVRHIALECVDRLSQLGDYRYNWSTGESCRLRECGWLDSRKIRNVISSLPERSGSGDIYARLINA
jgi:FkbM family methyltransferase